MSALPLFDATPSRQELISQYAPLVEQVIYKMKRTFPPHIDIDDMRQTGYIGLIQAIDRYQADKGCSLESYARIRIQGSIIDELRSKDWVPRSVRSRIKNLQSVRRELQATLKRKPSKEELRKYMGLSQEEYQRMYKRCDARTLLSMEEGAAEDRRVGDRIANTDRTPQEQAALNEELEYLKTAMFCLSQRERHIVELYYHQDYTFKEIACDMGVTESRVSQIHSRIKRKLRTAHKRAVFAG